MGELSCDTYISHDKMFSIIETSTVPMALEEPVAAPDKQKGNMP